jgi:hypothetical protein
MTVTLRLLKFGRLLCMCQHLYRIGGPGGNRIHLTLLAREHRQPWYMPAHCGPYGDRTRLSFRFLRDRQAATPSSPRDHLYSHQDSNPNQGLRRPLCYALHHGSVAGTKRFELFAIGLTARRYFHTSYIPLVAGTRFELVYLGYEPSEEPLLRNPHCWHWWT